MKAEDLMPGLAFSWSVLFVLLVIVAVSLVVFVWQARRWTTHAGWRALLDWSRERGFKLSRQHKPAAEPLDRLPGAKIVTSLESGATQALQLQLSGTDPAKPTRWHLLVRQTTAAWPATGLRPATAPASLLDLFSLSAHQRMGETERFVIVGSDSRSARVLSKSEARALLPPDIGLLLHGRHMVLDFSSRPFDGIELGRMVALADQLVQHLPVQA